MTQVQARPGRWYFGWNIVAAATFVTLLTVGMRLGIGPFFIPMADDLGFSRTLLATIIAVGMLFYGIGMPLAGMLVARFGTRFVLLVGTAIVMGSVLWAIVAREPWSLMMSFGVLLSVGLAFTSPVALTPVISRWFTRQRGMALFYLSTGSMAGIAIMTPLLTWAIETYSWQTTLLGFAIVFAMLTIPSALFIISDVAPENTDLLPSQITAENKQRAAAASATTFAEAVRTVVFWKICLGLFVCGFSMNLLGTHGMPMLMDHGFDSATSAMGISVIGIVAIFGTLILGRLADKLERRSILSVIYFVRGLGFFALVMVGTHVELFAASFVGGLVWAGSIAMSSAILADTYGVRLVGVLYGLAYLGHQFGATFSSWLGGWGYETFGTHWVAFGMSGSLLIVAGLISMTLPKNAVRG